LVGPEKDEWRQAVEEKYQRMVKYKVFKEIKKTDLPKDSKILSSPWAKKKKANGTNERK
jgi:hypothetical protein